MCRRHTFVAHAHPLIRRKSGTGPLWGGRVPTSWRCRECGTEGPPEWPGPVPDHDLSHLDPLGGSPFRDAHPAYPGPHVSSPAAKARPSLHNTLSNSHRPYSDGQRETACTSATIDDRLLWTVRQKTTMCPCVRIPTFPCVHVAGISVGERTATTTGHDDICAGQGKSPDMTVTTDTTAASRQSVRQASEHRQTVTTAVGSASVVHTGRRPDRLQLQLQP